MLLKEKVFIVTGASSGIGEELSKQLSIAGSKVVCAARRIDQLERVCQSINDSGGVSIPIQTDITAKDQCENLIKRSLESFGKIDALVLNAGISMWARFEEITDLSFFKTLVEVNYLGAVNCVYASLPHLKKTNGKIISCSTAQAIMGFPNHSGYSASKHALHGFLSTLAIENENDITILEAVLGWIKNTELRGNAFGANGKKHTRPPRKNSKESVELNECVKKIILGIKKDYRTVYVPKKLGLIPFLKVFWRRYLEYRSVKAVKESS